MVTIPTKYDILAGGREGVHVRLLNLIIVDTADFKPRTNQTYDNITARVRTHNMLTALATLQAVH